MGLSLSILHSFKPIPDKYLHVPLLNILGYVICSLNKVKYIEGAMKRVLLLFILINCIIIYPQRSTNLDSRLPRGPIVTDSRPPRGTVVPDSRPPRKPAIADSTPSRKPIITDIIYTAPPELITIFEESHSICGSGSYCPDLDESESGNSEDYEDAGQYEDHYYNDFDYGVKGFALSFVKCTYFDRNLFNLEEKIKLNPGYAFSAMIHVTDGEYNAAFDFRAAYQPIKFHENVLSYDLYLLSFGFRYRKNFGNEYSYPYLLGCLYFNKGYFNNGSEEPITFKSYTAGIGTGYSIYLNNRISLALEGTYEAGFGWWDDYPSFNSSGTAVNPNNLSFRVIMGVNF